MSTYRELIYLCIDELKLLSDDAHFSEDHIVYLLDKYRAFLLKQRYSDIKKQIPESNYQTIEVRLTSALIDSRPLCEGNTPEFSYKKSVDKIPFLMTIGKPRIYFDSYFTGEISYVTRDRFRYVGHNKYLSNIVYATIDPKHYLWLKKVGPMTECLNEVCRTFPNTVWVTGIFNSSSDALNNEDWDTEFPIEDALISPLIELVMKELSQHIYRPDDMNNNAKDDLSGLALKNG